jgi:hypothetical protein
MGKADKDSKDQGSQDQDKAQDDRFVNDLLVREEAVKPDASGKLPADATHAIVEQAPDGTATKVKRARFKLF